MTSELQSSLPESAASDLDLSKPIILNAHLPARNPNRKNAGKGGSGPLMSSQYTLAFKNKANGQVKLFELA